MRIVHVSRRPGNTKVRWRPPRSWIRRAAKIPARKAPAETGLHRRNGNVVGCSWRASFASTSLQCAFPGAATNELTSSDACALSMHDSQPGVLRRMGRRSAPRPPRHEVRRGPRRLAGRSGRSASASGWGAPIKRDRGGGPGSIRTRSGRLARRSAPGACLGAGPARFGLRSRCSRSS